MTGLDIAAIILILIGIGFFIFLFLFLAGLPGRIAKKRNHPYAEAITIGGYATLVMGAFGWPFVLMWAYMTPKEIVPVDRGIEGKRLQEEVQSLRERLDRLEA
jgi:Protein of unknown function (DUF3302)